MSLQWICQSLSSSLLNRGLGRHLDRTTSRTHMYVSLSYTFISSQRYHTGPHCTPALVCRLPSSVSFTRFDHVSYLISHCIQPLLLLGPQASNALVDNATELQAKHKLMGVNSSFDEPRKRLRTHTLSPRPLGKQLPTSQPLSSNRPHLPDRRRLVMSQPSSVSTNPHGKAIATATHAHNLHLDHCGTSSPLPSKSCIAQKQHTELAPGHSKGRPDSLHPAKSHEARKRAELVVHRRVKDHQRAYQRSKYPWGKNGLHPTSVTGRISLLLMTSLMMKRMWMIQMMNK
jgi:hypothetical protein